MLDSRLFELSLLLLSSGMDSIELDLMNLLEIKVMLGSPAPLIRSNFAVG